MAFTEFYCQNTADNRNAGSTNSDAPVYASTNGNWNNTTRIFTPSDGSNPSSFIAVGDFCSVFADAATVAAFVALVTAVTTTTVTLSGTFFIGTNPATAATGISLRAGGAWKGPIAGSNWPCANITNALRGSLDYLPRLNMKGNALGAYTPAGSGDFTPNSQCVNNNQFITIEGYLNTPGDGGFAVFDSNGSGGGISIGGTGSCLRNLIIQNFTGLNAVLGTGTGCLLHRCIGRKTQYQGFVLGTGALAVECELWDFDSNANTVHGFNIGAGGGCIRCYVHDAPSSSSSTSGFILGANGGFCLECVAFGMRNLGFQISVPAAGSSVSLINCDSIQNGAGGYFINAFSPSQIYFENCTAFKNTGFGWNFPNGRTTVRALLVNCASGTGSMANTSGRHTDLNIIDVDPVIFPPGEHPWNSYVNRDWRVVHPLAAAGKGRGKFMAGPLVAGARPTGSLPQSFETYGNMRGIGANLYVPKRLLNFDSPTQMLV
jgi:hypothetical protein